MMVSQSNDRNESLFVYKTAKAITESGRVSAEISSAVDIVLNLRWGFNAIVKGGNGAILSIFQGKRGIIYRQ